MPNLSGARKRYARKLQRVARLRNPFLIRAFAEVPREKFLGPPPWPILGPKGYWKTDKPRALYDDVLVGIIPERFLNNGKPGALASWFDALDLRRNERVVHIGCGTGYYSAILAHIVGPGGHVTAIEIDTELAPRAKKNLAHLRHVDVIHGDGTALGIGAADAVFVNAGANYPIESSLDAVNPGGRIAFPIITTEEIRLASFYRIQDRPKPTTTWLGRLLGVMILARRDQGGTSAKPISTVGIFPCINTIKYDADRLAAVALKRGDYETIRSIRRDPHTADESCWLHHDGACISRKPVA